jgi:hypothetical protein
MASTIRAQRLMNAKNDVDKAKTLISKIAALRELLAVPDVGRIYQRYAQRKIVECRAEAVAAANDELLRRLDYKSAWSYTSSRRNPDWRANTSESPLDLKRAENRQRSRRQCPRNRKKT